MLQRKCSPSAAANAAALAEAPAYSWSPDGPAAPAMPGSCPAEHTPASGAAVLCALPGAGGRRAQPHTAAHLTYTAPAAADGHALPGARSWLSCVHSAVPHLNRGKHSGLLCSCCLGARFAAVKAVLTQPQTCGQADGGLQNTSPRVALLDTLLDSVGLLMLTEATRTQHRSSHSPPMPWSKA